MRSGRLRKRVSIERDSGASQDSYGQHQSSWAELAERWAAIEPVSGKELIDAQQQRGLVTHKVTLRYGADIATLSSADRIKLGSRILNIESVLNEGERNKEFTLLCTEDVS